MTDVATYVRAALAVIILASGTAKVADLRGFRTTVRALLTDSDVSPGLPRRAVERITSLTVPAGEIIIALFVLAAVLTAQADIALAAVLALFTLVSIYGWQSAPQVSCKCFGALTQASFSGRTVIRNVVLLAASAGILLVHPVVTRLSTAEIVLLVLTAGGFGMASTVASRSLETARRPNQPRHMVYADD